MENIRRAQRGKKENRILNGRKKQLEKTLENFGDFCGTRFLSGFFATAELDFRQIAGLSQLRIISIKMIGILFVVEKMYLYLQRNKKRKG